MPALFEVIQQSAGRAIPVRIADENVAWAAREIAARCTDKKIIHIVSDERVALHYLADVAAALGVAGCTVSHSVIAGGEINKTLPTAARILDELACNKLPRDGLIVGLGGGVVTDMAGFVAAIYHRGVEWIAVPTSLLGMVDAAIGGKTGVDHALGKNLIGAFHQPVAVIAPTQVLQTLDAREWRSGSAEVVKSALLAGGELWELVCKNGVDLSNWPANGAGRAIQLAARTKVEIVNQDEREAGPRRLLNFGHTFGHAIEAVTGYTPCTHGEAVFLGMRAALKISAAMYRMNEVAVDTVDMLLERMPIPRLKLEHAALLEAISRDKKIAQGRIHWVLLETVGRGVVTADVKESVVVETAEWLCEIAANGAEQVVDARRKRILLLNGPNLNLLGIREPHIYGAQTLTELEAFAGKIAAEEMCELFCRQTPHEGELVELIQWARHWADGIIINPGGYTHSSVAIRDAISAAQVPTIEVHLSDIGQREEFRRRSLLAEVCISSVVGKGFEGYAEALRSLARRV